jgi:ankyrin repeat protein
MDAVRSDNFELVNLLLSRGANVHAKTNYRDDPQFAHLLNHRGDTPLHLLSYRVELGERSKIGDLLIEHGADIKAKNDQHITPDYSGILRTYNCYDCHKMFKLYIQCEVFRCEECTQNEWYRS